MANFTRNFISGRMNKVVDERLVPNGEYIDALNVRMGSTEKSEIGVIENSKGNSPLTSIKYIDGTPLSLQAKCIGAIDDSANETLYWFIHDSDFPVGNTGKLDMIVSFNVLTGILTYHVVSIDDGGGANTTLNFNPSYLITGIDIVEDLLFFTDDYNPPRVLNRKRNYPDPVANIDQFSAESLLVIKKPPVESPTIQLITTGNQSNYLQDRFICFAYRYRYEDGEYSAISQFSEPAFQPNPFQFSINSFLNEGMVNLNNSVIITYNSGGPLVKAIDLLFKDASGNIIKVIEKLDKSILGLSDNTDYQYTFTNSKIFTILPQSELLRLYDNVPLLAKAQTVMGNRLMYGNYVEGYDIVDNTGAPVKFEYEANLVSELIDTTNITETFSSGIYSYGSSRTVVDSIVYIDLSDVDLVEGSSITLEIRISHESFAGSTPFPTETSENISATFSFTLPTNYTSVYELATSVAFQDAVGTVANIQSVSNSCNGTTFTDQINCALPNNLDALIKFESGISVPAQPISIISSPSSQLIGFQMTAMRYVDNTTTPTVNVYEYYSIVFAEAFYQKINSPRSLHSNRGYEIGIVYMDDFNRSTTALVSPNNTVHVPCSASDTKNSIQVTIPATQKAPYWAKRYKFVIKPDEENYDTIYSSIFFDDPLSNNAYFLLEGENARKVEQGDRLIVKADTSGPTNSCVYATVLEKESKPSGFIEVPSVLDPSVNIPVPSGVYMKINPNSFAVVQDELSVIAPGTKQVDQNDAGEYPILDYDMNRYDTATSAWVDYTVPAGSRIKISFKFQRLGVGAGNGACERRIYTLEKTLTSSADYNNMQDWFNGDNVADILNDGFQEVGAGGPPIQNTYISTLATSLIDIPTATDTNYYRFYRNLITNKLSLLMSGTVRCGGILSVDKRRSSIISNVEVFRAETTLIFETEPSAALPDVFYENNLSFGIDANGNHLGNVQNQNISIGQSAIVNTEFFNCFAFGNGAESYKIRDSIIGRTFNLGNRVTSVSAQDYKRVDRFADITYSGVYNLETNVNKLNEFNMGLLNYKNLEVSFGPIYRLDGRETDVLTLQEDKISYVLAGKNLLSDAAAGGAITSVPEVLGTQIARVEKYGISFHPESYVQWGYDRYFTDVKRGAVIQIKGNSYSSDQLRVVSESGMRTWFRDNFIESFGTQKLGGYDPYLNEYVLVTNDTPIPQPQECLSCGISQTFTIASGDSVTYCVDLGVPIGDSTVSYSVPVESTSDFIVQAVYNNVSVSSGTVSTSGDITIDKNFNNISLAEITITAVDDVTLTVNVQCPVAEFMTVICVCVTSLPEAGQFIHNEYRYTDGTFTSPLQSNLVTFSSVAGNPIVSQYLSITGVIGTGGFPTPGSTVTIASNKIGFDNFVFDATSDKFKYLRTNTLYPNTSVGINGLLSASTQATPITGSGNYYSSSFTNPSTGQYLYLIWDYRNSLPLELCYTSLTAFISCCDCPTSATYYLDAPSLDSASAIYSNSNLTTLAPNGFYSDNVTVREQSVGVLLPEVPCPDCNPTYGVRIGETSEDSCLTSTPITNVTGNNEIFCNNTEFTSPAFALLTTGTYYVSRLGKVLEISVTTGNSVATVVGSCFLCTAGSYEITNCGVSNVGESSACSDSVADPKTLYTDCPTLNVGCGLYWDQALTSPVTQLYVFALSNWDMDGNGIIVSYSATQC
jgi:hypothetical protein